VRKHKGVDAYYNLDNPLPDAEEQALVDMKEKLESGEYL